MFDNHEKEYELTETGKRLRSEIKNQIKNNELNKEQGEIVFQQAAGNYYRVMNNPHTPGDTELKSLMTYFPDTFSLLDIIKISTPIIKSILLVSAFNSEEVIELFTSKKAIYEKIDWVFNGNNICIFVHVNQYVDIGDYRNPSLNVGRLIFSELKERKIHVGFYVYSNDNSPTLSDFSRGFMTINSLGINSKIVDYSSGFRKDVGSGFRSAWEANIARIFNLLNIKWEYEKDSFKLESEHFNGFYFPDFFLSDNVIMEVKGFWNSDSRQKAMLFSAQYPDHKLLLIDNDLYYDLDRKYKEVLPFWEKTESRIDESSIQVVGINQPTRKNTVASLNAGDSLLLVRDSGNQYDKNAIMVTTITNQQVGFVSKDWACILAPKMDLGIEYSTRIKEKNQNVIELNIRRSNLEKEIIPEIFNLQHQL